MTPRSSTASAYSVKLAGSSLDAGPASAPLASADQPATATIGLPEQLCAQVCETPPARSSGTEASFPWVGSARQLSVILVAPRTTTTSQTRTAAAAVIPHAGHVRPSSVLPQSWLATIRILVLTPNARPQGCHAMLGTTAFHGSPVGRVTNVCGGIYVVYTDRGEGLRVASTAQFIAATNTILARGDATEHTFRPSIEAWIESFGTHLRVTNEPRQSENNAPDFDVKIERNHGWLSIGKIEAKAPSKNQASGSSTLAKAHTDSERTVPRTPNGEQLARYRKAFTNLLYTDSIDFHWYKNGELTRSASLGSLKNGQLEASPTGPKNVESLVLAFLEQAPQRVRSARALAVRLAGMASIIRDVLGQSFLSASASDTTLGLKNAFQDTLVPDLTDEQFSDMLAQTIAYGLFAARAQQSKDQVFSRYSAASSIPKTNPFLRGLFAHVTSESLDDEPYAGIVDDIAQLLNDTDIEKVLKNFGQERRDPIVHFYETFLTAYDPELRDIRGVYYTPLSVVDFIVDSVDEILKSSFQLSDGLADTMRTQNGDHRVLVLDPAAGTGTFLYAAIRKIRDSFVSQGRSSMWASYVSAHILPRFFGFELMVAPYAVAHLKLALQLAGKDLPPESRGDIAYDFEKDERIGVYLTNALEPGEAHSTLPLGKFISDEANAASAVKTDKPIMVVIGNPPYQGQSANASKRREYWRTVKGKRQYKTVKTSIGNLMESYYEINGEPLGEQNSKWLQDDYAKFIRLAQARIETTGTGVLAFVTNHTYLDAPTFRGMRHSLLSTFDEIYIADLHGSIRRREVNPNGGPDENVFDEIQQGVAIAIFVKKSEGDKSAVVHYMDLWGRRQDKYQWLESHSVNDVDWTTFTPVSPFYAFRPEDTATRAEWDACVSITDIFPLNSGGVVTSRDSLVIDTRRDRLIRRINYLVDATIPTSEVRRVLFGTNSRTTRSGEVYAAGDNRDWKLEEKRIAVGNDQERANAYIPITYRPFDFRYIFYHPHAVDNMHREAMDHMLFNPSFPEGNIGFVSARSNKTSTQDQFFVSRYITEAKTGESSTQSRLFPLWVYEIPRAASNSEQGAFDLPGAGDTAQPRRVANIGDEVRHWIQEKLGLALCEDSDCGDLETSAGPRDILAYVYGIVHSRHYRIRYADFMQRDFARVPLTVSRELFRMVSGIGHKLIRLHLLTDATLDSGPAVAPSLGDNSLDKLRVSERWVEGDDGENGHIVLNLSGGVNGVEQVLPNVSRAVWEFQVGGYRVLHKWLDARATGEKLSYDEILHLVKTVNAISRTLEIQDELDELLTNWPLVPVQEATTADHPQ